MAKRKLPLGDEVRASAFDLAFLPLYGPSNAERRSAFEVILRKTYSEAAAGKLGAIRLMLSIMRSNAKARAEAEGAKVKLVAASGRRKIVSAGPALRLLGIAVPFQRSDTLGLLPWVVDLLRSRGAGESLLKELQPHFRADEGGVKRIAPLAVGDGEG